jgi:hypothetical protein
MPCLAPWLMVLGGFGCWVRPSGSTEQPGHYLDGHVAKKGGKNYNVHVCRTKSEREGGREGKVAKL